MRVKSMITVAPRGGVDICSIGGACAGSDRAAETAGRRPFSDDDAQAVLDARLIALKTVIKLTPEQEKLWPRSKPPSGSSSRQSAAERRVAAQQSLPADDVRRQP